MANKFISFLNDNSLGGAFGVAYLFLGAAITGGLPALSKYMLPTEFSIFTPVQLSVNYVIENVPASVLAIAALTFVYYLLGAFIQSLMRGRK